MASNLKGLIGKLNDTARTGLEAAAGFCLSRTHYDIEIEHFLMKLLEVTDSDLQHILKHFAVSKSHFASDLTSSLDKLKTGNARTPVFSPSLVQMLSEAWTAGSLDFGAAQVRSGFCILAIAASPDLARLMREVTREFQKISEETLRKNFWNIVAGSPEDHETAQAADQWTARISGAARAVRASGPYRRRTSGRPSRIRRRRSSWRFASGDFCPASVSSIDLLAPARSYSRPWDRQASGLYSAARSMG